MPIAQHKAAPSWRNGMRTSGLSIVPIAQRQHTSQHVGKMSMRAVFSMLDWDLDLRGRSKFEDPWMTQGRGAGGTPSGREYLAGLPMGGAVRVDAMLAKIAGPDGDRIIPAELELRAVGEVIRQRIDADALKTRESVWRGWDYILDKTGLSGNVYAIAIIGAAKWLTTQFDISNTGAFAKAKAMADGSIETALGQMAFSIDKGIPYPWHAFEITPLDIRKLRDTITKTKDSLDDFTNGMKEVIGDVGTSETALDLLDAASRSLRCNNQRWFGNKTHTGAPDDEGKLPAEVIGVATGWWSMLLSGLTNAEVVRAFHAMHGDAWGALNMASDEQVMVVASAVSSAYGVPLRELAIALWDRSPGWSAEPVLLSQVGCLGLGDYGKTPTNATQVQWWQLGRNAVAIASAMKAGKPTPMMAPYNPLNPSTAKPVTAPIPVVESIGVTFRRARAAIAENVRAHKLPYTVVALGAAMALSVTIARAWMRP